MWMASTGLIAILVFLFVLGTVISAQQRKTKRRLSHHVTMPQANTPSPNEMKQDQAIRRAAQGGPGAQPATGYPRQEATDVHPYQLVAGGK